MRIALLISGGGSTAASIITAVNSKKLIGITPVCVIASSGSIEGINRVVLEGIPEDKVFVVDPKTFSSSEAFGKRILQICEDEKVDFIGQYGWLCLTPKNVIEKYSRMMTNQHPGPLDPGRPDFGGRGMFGKRVHAARMLFAQKTQNNFWTEATCQRVGVKFDEGAVLHKKRLDFLPTDSAEDIATKLLTVEHEVQIETLQMFANNSVAEIIRDEPLVKPEEYAILEECKKQAINLYPNG